MRTFTYVCINVMLLDKLSREEEEYPLQVAPRLSGDNTTPRTSLDVWEGGLVGMGLGQELYAGHTRYGNGSGE